MAVEQLNYRQESCRNDRIYNIAVAIKEIKASGKNGTRCSALRSHIRSKLGLQELTNEEKLGDLRAHGDAIGGHGLHLEVTRKKVQGKNERIIMFTDDTMEKCNKYITTAKSHEEQEIF